MRLSFVLLSLIVSSCDYQVFDITSTQPKLITAKNYTFENDTIQIQYNFWAAKGIMDYRVFNKLNKPIYIDWKNSFFILNDQRWVYWDDQIVSATAGMGSSRMFSYFNRSYNGYLYQSVSNSIRPERITSIPPKSYYSRSSFLLIKNQYNMEKNKKIEFTYSDSPLKFRNYLAISLTEVNPVLNYIDNEFYVNRVRILNTKKFNNYAENKATSFYFKIQKGDYKLNEDNGYIIKK